MAKSLSKKNVILAQAGRAPWYSSNGVPLEAFVVGIAGGSASGKTRVAQEILKAIKVPWVLVVSQDSFYKPLTKDQSALAFDNKWDFDHPNALDFDLLYQCIADLKASKAVDIPIYSFVKHQREKESQYLYGAAVIIVEGILVLHDSPLRSLFDLKIFVQCDSDLMLARRIRRDIIERGRDVDGILNQYLYYVKPSFDNFVQPSSRHADIIVPGLSNSTAISLVVTHIREKLEQRSLRIRNQLFQTPGQSLLNTPATGMEARRLEIGEGIKIEDDDDTMVGLPTGLKVMKETAQLKAIHTILRDETTSLQDFVNFADRLGNLLIEFAMSFLPYRRKEIKTRTGVKYTGMELDVKHLVGVSILRSGSCFEKSLRAVVRDVSLGSMLIQPDASGEQLLYNLELPKVLKKGETAKESHVLLLDSQIGTGAAAIMAIRVLLDHGVPESNIIMVTFLVSRQVGIQHISRAFPKVKIITSAVDDFLDERYVFPNPEYGKPGSRRGKTISVSVNQISHLGIPTSDFGKGLGLGLGSKSQFSPLSQRIIDGLQKRGGIWREEFVDEYPDTFEEEDTNESELVEEAEGVKFYRDRKNSGDEFWNRRKRGFCILPGMGAFGDRYFGT